MEWVVADTSGDGIFTKGDKFSTTGNGRGTSTSSTKNTANSYSAELRMIASQEGSNYYEGGASASGYTRNKNGFTLEVASDNAPVLKAGSSVTFAYKLTTHDKPFYTNGNIFTKGTNDVYTSYSGTVESLKNEPNSTPFHDGIKYDGSSPSLFKSIGDITVDPLDLDVTGNMSFFVRGTGLSSEKKESSVDLESSNAADDLAALEFDYGLALVNKTDESNKFDYGENIVYVFEDAVPDGMVLVENSVQAFHGGVDMKDDGSFVFKDYSGQNDAFAYVHKAYQPGIIDTDNRIPSDKVSIEYDGSKAKIVIRDTSLNWTSNSNSSDPIVVIYTLKLSDNKIQEILASKAAGDAVNEVLTNTAIAKLYKNYGTPSQVDVTQSNTTEADLKFQEETIAPGVEKEGESVSDVIMPDNNWGNGAKWTIRVSNNDDDELEIVDMAGFTVKDTIPVGSRFYGLACDEAISISDPTPGTFPEDEYADAMKASWTASTGAAGEIDAYFYDENGTKGAKVTSPDGTGGKIIGFRFEENTLTLKKGEYVDITFYTSNADYDAELDSWITPVGSVTNHVDVTFDDGFSNKTVKKGTYEGNKTVWAEATEQIGGINTLSYKSINYPTPEKISDYDKIGEEYLNNGYGDEIKHDSTTDRFDPEDTEEYGRVVQGLQGDIVHYTLNVKNGAKATSRDGSALSAGDSCMENITIIDRLPYVGDKGVITYERGSAFPVELLPSSIAVSVRTDGSTDTPLDPSQYTVSYSSDDPVLDEYSGDWAGKNDLMTWDDEYDVTKTTFRIVISDEIMLPPGGYVTVEFNGKVSPFTDVTAKSTQDAIENNKVAWNSFAYSYKTHDTKTGLSWDDTVVSEPAMVGVWVKESEAKITVNKTYKTNSTEENTFWFSLFTKDGDTFKPYGTPKSLTMTGSEEGNTETLEFNNLVPTETLYVFETDKEGNILKSTPEQKITYNGTEFVSEAAEVENKAEKFNASFMNGTSDSESMIFDGSTLTLTGKAAAKGNVINISYTNGMANVTVNEGSASETFSLNPWAWPTPVTTASYTCASDDDVVISGINDNFNITVNSGAVSLNVDITNELIVGTIEVEKTLIPLITALRTPSTSAHSSVTLRASSSRTASPTEERATSSLSLSRARQQGHLSRARRSPSTTCLSQRKAHTTLSWRQMPRALSLRRLSLLVIRSQTITFTRLSQAGSTMLRATHLSVFLRTIMWAIPTSQTKS